MAGPKVKKNLPFQPSGDTSRIISLAGGSWAYLCDHLGKTHKFERDSQNFAIKCKEVDEIMNGKIIAELTALGWLDVIERMDTNVQSPEELATETAN